MDFFLQQNNLLILAVAAGSGAMLLFGMTRKGTASSSVTVQQAVQLINREQGIFLDIRSPEQFKSGSIPQARHVARDQIDAKAASLPKNKPIVVVCDTGQQAGAVAAKLRKLGHEGAVSLQGGLRSWTQDGMPLAKKG